MGFKLDMTMMFTMHDALRRELERIERISRRTDDDPRRILKAAVGWELFKTYLVIHHTAEDDKVWPVMEQALAERPDDLALLAALEAEHAAIDPLLAGIDAALVDRDHGHEQLGGLVDALHTGLSGHLKHEEGEGLALIDATMNEQQWTAFGQEHGTRVFADARRYLPWVLDEADEERAALILSRMPEAIHTAYRDEWQPAYVALDIWKP